MTKCVSSAKRTVELDGASWMIFPCLKMTLLTLLWPWSLRNAPHSVGPLSLSPSVFCGPYWVLVVALCHSEQALHLDTTVTFCLGLGRSTFASPLNRVDSVTTVSLLWPRGAERPLGICNLSIQHTGVDPGCTPLQCECPRFTNEAPLAAESY